MPRPPAPADSRGRLCYCDARHVNEGVHMFPVGHATVAMEHPGPGSPADGDRCARPEHDGHRYRPVRRYGSSSQRDKGA